MFAMNEMRGRPVIPHNAQSVLQLSERGFLEYDTAKYFMGSTQRSGDRGDSGGRRWLIGPELLADHEFRLTVSDND